MQRKQALKIGILTFHRCINYGSYWQARCLAEGLQSAGHHVEILDHHSSIINLKEWKCAYRPTLPAPSREADYPLYRLKMEKFFEAFASLPLSPRFSLYHPQQMNRYDVAVVGSDEVWNLLHPWYGNFPLFYGEGLRAERVISYAASFGNYPAIWGLSEEWSRRLNNFDSISVRDENSWWLVKNATGQECPIVLDPCLQFDIKVPRANVAKEEKYIAVYGHNFTVDFVQQAKSAAARKNLPLISIGYYNNWTDDNIIDAGPVEFAQFISAAAGVLTNFFHGCVFSLRFQKPFACEASNYRSNKVQGLMTLLDGMHHFFNAGENDFIEKTLSKPITQRLLQNIEKLSRQSQEFLAESLDKDQLQVA